MNPNFPGRPLGPHHSNKGPGYHDVSRAWFETVLQVLERQEGEIIRIEDRLERIENKGHENALNGRDLANGLRTELEGKIDGLRIDMKGEVAEMSTEVNSVKTRIATWGGAIAVITWIITLLASGVVPSFVGDQARKPEPIFYHDKRRVPPDTIRVFPSPLPE